MTSRLTALSRIDYAVFRGAAGTGSAFGRPYITTVKWVVARHIVSRVGLRNRAQRRPSRREEARCR